jgi:type I restriction enzyme S subunit
LVTKYTVYPEYGYSGVEWLGDAPKHWKSIPIGRLFRRTKRTDFIDKQLLSVYRDYGVIPKASRDDNNNKPSEDLTPYQLVEPNDLVMNKMKTWQGSIAISEHEGIVSPAYFVYQPEPKMFDLAFPKYIHYLLRNPMYIAQYLRQSKGIRVNQWDLDPNEFQRIELLLPDKDEQIKIFQFLDHETAKIDTLIDKQQQLITLLKEKRQAVISHAVTKGLNPRAPMRDSGVEWLGEVPAHWTDSEIRYITRQMGGGTPSKERTDYWNGSIPWVSPKDMKIDYIDDAQDKITTQAVQESSTKLIPVGSVLIVVRGMILVHSVPVALTQSEVTINQDMKALIPTRGIDGEFLLFFMKGLRDFILDLVEESAHGTKCLRSEVFERMKITMPALEEQIGIVAQLKERVGIVDSLIEKAQCGIELLNERRTALISAAVTGKIDVRNWKTA